MTKKYKYPLVVAVLILLLSGCGGNEQQEIEDARQQELQELSEEMDGILLRVGELKMQLRDSIADWSAGTDSSKLVQIDQYRLLLTELEETEAAYQAWKEEITYEPEGMEHEQAMDFYEQEEKKAELIRMDIRRAIEQAEVATAKE
ncbi:hypothetical protein [Nafulsella turpanensis]|uniref:hypothetical protein n=1 Tax=Nafulsella turpanensis TaxID=1265690 RepID=UPI000344EDF7|nr:hypothetical protein [Nafulsella turpanensis]